jgi:hypothetical protein
MESRYRIALAAIALAAVVLLIGYQLLIAPNSDEPPSAETPLPSAMDYTAHEGDGAPLAPGRYRFDYASPVGVTVTVPDAPYEGFPSAWFKGGHDWVLWHQTHAARFGVALVDNLYADPCSPDRRLEDPPVGPTIDDLAEALDSVPHLVAQSSTEVTVDRYPGRLVDTTVGNPPLDCVDEPAIWLTTRGDRALMQMVHTGLDRTRIWILDVEGSRLVVWATLDPHWEDPEYTTIRSEAEDALQGVVDSIQIEAP